MRILIDMVHILDTWHKYNKKQWISFEHILSDKERELLSMIRSDISQAEIKSHKSITARIRNSLATKLCKQVTFFPEKSSDFTDYQLAEIECNNLLYSLKSVSALGISKSSLLIADKLLIQCRKYDLTNHRMAVLKYLCSYHAIAGSNKYSTYSEEYALVRSLVNVEDTALHFYNQLIYTLVETKEERQLLYKRSLAQLVILDNFIQNNLVTNQFFVNYYKFATLTAQLIGQHKEALYYAQQGYLYFDSLPYKHIQGVQQCLILKFNSQLKLSQPKMARSNIQQFFSSGVTKGSPEWINTMRLFVKFELSLKNYQKAYQEHCKLTQDKLYRSLPAASKSQEIIVEQYFNVLILMGFVQPVSNPSRVSINRFLKKEPNLQFHKKQLAIAVTVLQLLFNIYYKEYDSIISRLETLKDYCARRLSRKSLFFRSNLFIRMLLVIPGSRFNAIAAKRNAKNYLRRLEQTNKEFTISDSTLEIIPYEHLWEIVLSNLKQPKLKLSKSLKVVKK